MSRQSTRSWHGRRISTSRPPASQKRPKDMPTEEPSTDKTIRIAVVGDGNTGKTCMLIGYKDKVYSDVYIPTVFDSYSMNIPIYNEIYRLILQDTAGQEDYDKLRPLGYTETHCFIVCYAVDRPESYENVFLKWSREVRHYRPGCKIILVGTKVDKRDGANETLTFEDGLRLQKQIRADDFYECSAKELYNLDQVFTAALMACVKKPPTRKQRQCRIL